MNYLGRKVYLWWVVWAFWAVGCSDREEEWKEYTLTVSQQQILSHLPSDLIIAHRGTSYWAPEGSEAAMRWARNAGASYLEFDLQKTRDGYLVVSHDQDLRQQTNVETVYPARAAEPISSFTLEELLRLDTSGAFNRKHPKVARQRFEGQGLLTLEDVVRIAEGYRICRDDSLHRLYTVEGGRVVFQYEPDPYDNGNRPGIYPEVKNSELYGDMETRLKAELTRLGWYAESYAALKSIPVESGCVGVANTPSRVVIQTLSLRSLEKLQQTFGHSTPFCFLISSGTPVDRKEYTKWINAAVRYGAVIIGPSVARGPEDYQDLLTDWMYELIHEKGLKIHAYTFNEEAQVTDYMTRVDGYITDKTIEIKKYVLQLRKQPLVSAQSTSQLLDQLGY